jgi:predicted O-methyltransferase YrrM
MNEQAALYRILAEVARDLQPKTYLEIGCREGDSLRCVLDAAPSVNFIVICDTWGGEYGGTARGNHEHVDAMLAARNYGGVFSYWNGPSQAALPLLRGEFASRFNLILVDGDHSEEGARADLENVWPLLRVGGILVFDDCFNGDYPYLASLICSFTKKVGAEVIAGALDHAGAVAIRKVRE